MHRPRAQGHTPFSGSISAPTAPRISPCGNAISSNRSDQASGLTVPVDDGHIALRIASQLRRNVNNLASRDVGKSHEVICVSTQSLHCHACRLHVRRAEQHFTSEVDVPSRIQSQAFVEGSDIVLWRTTPAPCSPIREGRTRSLSLRVSGYTVVRYIAPENVQIVAVVQRVGSQTSLADCLFEPWKQLPLRAAAKS